MKEIDYHDLIRAREECSKYKHELDEGYKELYRRRLDTEEKLLEAENKASKIRIELGRKPSTEFDLKGE
jgi:hypothetical protein